jgi:hypothetical protein
MNTERVWIKRGIRFGVMMMVILAGVLSLPGCQCTGSTGTCSQGMSDGGMISGSDSRTGGSTDLPGG